MIYMRDKNVYQYNDDMLCREMVKVIDGTSIKNLNKYFVLLFCDSWARR